MASSGYKKSNKPELVAIYRLEFYKNKKKWKFCNEKTREKTVPTRESSDTERNLALDKTYSVEQYSDGEATSKEKTSPLNNAFIHEIPYDIPSPEVTQPPPPPPTPQPTEIWPEETSEHGLLFKNDIWMKDEVTGQPIINTQSQQWTNRHPIHPQSQESWANQNQPIDLQWSMKTAGNHPDEWQPNTGPNESEWTNKLQPTLQKTQNEEMSIINGPEVQPTWPNNATQNQFYPAVWTNTPQNKGPIPSQPKAQGLWETQNLSNQISGLPANSLQMLLCPDKWKKQPIPTQNSLEPPKINPDDWTKPPPGYKPDAPDIWTGPPENPQIINPDFLSKPPPVIPIQLRKNPDKWTNQQNHPLNNSPDTFNNQTPNSWLFTRPPPIITPAENPQKIAQSANIKNITPTYVKPSPDVWPNNQKGPVNWTNPALLLNIEQQNIWTNQAWQKQQDVLQNKDKDWVMTVGEDVNDGVRADDEDIADLQPQYTNDQCTTKPHLSPEPYEPQTAELVRESTDCWLSRLQQVYHTDALQDTSQLYLGDDTTVEFIREAHGVPHSSENDPSELDECACWYMREHAPACMSPARLSAAILHTTNTLRAVLREQLIRDRLKNRRVISLEEYPTRDTDLFGCEYVLSGSHIPRSVGELAGERVIKIDMGRPYRL